MEDAQDVAQEAFLKLHKHLRSFRHPGEIGAWLYRVTVNLSFDVRRRQKRPAPPPAMRPAEGPHDIVAREEEQRMLAAALDELGERERAAIVLRELEELSTEQVARILGSSESTVRVQVSKARLKLRTILERLQGRKQ
jgi:RNA polymerase sigma-70 factor (ECF subfamily)